MGRPVIGLRTYARYGAPLTLVSVIAFLPLYLLVRRVGPGSAANVKTVLELAWLVAGSAWIVQLAVVGAAAPLVGTRRSQWQALRAAGRGLVRAALPCVAVAGTVLVGGMALVVPALVLLVVLALTGASQAAGMPAPLEESVRVARRAPWRLAAIVAAMLLANVAIALIALRVPHARPKKPVDFATYRRVLPLIVAGIAVVTPVFACLLASFHRRHGAAA